MEEVEKVGVLDDIKRRTAVYEGNVFCRYLAKRNSGY